MPPGLEEYAGDKDACHSNQVLPPGLEEASVDDVALANAMCFPSCFPAEQMTATVQICNMPNHLLSDAMMEATLQQACLDELVLSFITTPGKGFGEARIILANVEAAEKCTRHFHGRSWGVSSAAVSAWIVGEEFQKKQKSAKPKRKAALWPTRTPTALCADAPAFEPSFALSANAPEFVPGRLGAFSASKVQSAIGSDVSTDDGEWASDEEKEVAAVSASC